MKLSSLDLLGYTCHRMIVNSMQNQAQEMLEVSPSPGRGAQEVLLRCSRLLSFSWHREWSSLAKYHLPAKIHHYSAGEEAFQSYIEFNFYPLSN